MVITFIMMAQFNRRYADFITHHIEVVLEIFKPGYKINQRAIGVVIQKISLRSVRRHNGSLNITGIDIMLGYVVDEMLEVIE